MTEGRTSVKYDKFILSCACCISLSSILLFVLTGCGNKLQERTNIEFHKNGSVSYTILEPFDTGLYDLDALETSIEEEIQKYSADGSANTSAKEPDGSVSLKSVSMTQDGDMVRVQIDFPSAESYRDFSASSTMTDEVILFYGSLADAMEAGYDLDISLIKNSSGHESLDPEKLKGLGKKYKLLIYSELQRAVLPGKIRYYSGNLMLEDDRTVLPVSMGTLRGNPIKSGSMDNMFYVVIK